MANVTGKIAVEYTIVEIAEGDNKGKFQAHVSLKGDLGRGRDHFTYVGRSCDTKGEALSWAVGFAFDFVNP